MEQKRNTQWILLLSCAFFLLNIYLASTAFAATSSITVTKTPFLSFIDVPDSFSIGSIATTSGDTELTSDADGNLPTERHLTIRDTRGCGGINLQLQADDFSPASTQIIKDNILVVTSTNDQLSEPVVGNVEYITGFSGDQTITAPLNTASTTFSDENTYTAVSNNDLSVARNLLQGNLTAPTGRDGQMHVSLSFYLLVPKLTIPNDYYTTFTYTLSDDTTGSCP